MWSGKVKRWIRLSNGLGAVSRIWFRAALIVVLVMLHVTRPLEQPPSNRSRENSLPFTADDLDRASLIAAVQQSLTALRKKSGTEILAVSGRQVTVSQVREGLGFVFSPSSASTIMRPTLGQSSTNILICSNPLPQSFSPAITNPS